MALALANESRMMLLISNILYVLSMKKLLTFIEHVPCYDISKTF